MGLRLKTFFFDKSRGLKFESPTLANLRLLDNMGKQLTPLFLVEKMERKYTCEEEMRENPLSQTN